MGTSERSGRAGIWRAFKNPAWQVSWFVFNIYLTSFCYQETRECSEEVYIEGNEENVHCF